MFELTMITREFTICTLLQVYTNGINSLIDDFTTQNRADKIRSGPSRS